MSRRGRKRRRTGAVRITKIKAEPVSDVSDYPSRTTTHSVGGALSPLPQSVPSNPPQVGNSGTVNTTKKKKRVIVRRRRVQRRKTTNSIVPPPRPSTRRQRAPPSPPKIRKRRIKKKKKKKPKKKTKKKKKKEVKKKVVERKSSVSSLLLGIKRMREEESKKKKKKTKPIKMVVDLPPPPPPLPSTVPAVIPGNIEVPKPPPPPPPPPRVENPRKPRIVKRSRIRKRSNRPPPAPPKQKKPPPPPNRRKEEEEEEEIKSLEPKRKRRKITTEKKQKEERKERTTRRRKRQKKSSHHGHQINTKILYNHYNVFMNIDQKLKWGEDTMNHSPFPIIQNREEYEKVFQPPGPDKKVFFKFGYRKKLYKRKKKSEPTYTPPQFPSLYTSVEIIPGKISVVNCGQLRSQNEQLIIHRILTIPVSKKSNENHVLVCTQPKYSRPEFYQGASSSSNNNNNGKSYPLQVYRIEKPEEEGTMKINLKMLLNHRHGFIQDVCWYPFKCPSNLGILFIAFSDGQIGTYVVGSKDDHEMELKDNPGVLFSFQFRNKYDSRIMPCRIKVTNNFRYVIVGAFDGTLHLLKIRPFYKATNSGDVNGDGRLQLVQTIQGHFPYFSTKNNCAVRGLDISYINPSIVSSVGGDGIMRFWDIRSFGSPLSNVRVGRLWGTCCKWSFHSNKVYVSGHEGSVGMYFRTRCTLDFCDNSAGTAIWEMDVCRDRSVLDFNNDDDDDDDTYKEEGEVPIGMTREAGLRERAFCVGQDGSILKVFQTKITNSHIFRILETEYFGTGLDLCYRVGWIGSTDDEVDDDCLNKVEEENSKKETPTIIDLDEEEEEEEVKKKTKKKRKKQAGYNQKDVMKVVNFLDEKPALYAIQFQKVLVKGMGKDQIMIVGGNHGLSLFFKIQV